MAEKKKKPEIRFKNFTDNWEQSKVGDYYDFKNGLNKGKEYFGRGTPIVNFTDVFRNRGITSEILKGKVTLEQTDIKNYEVKKGDLFFTRTSETIEEIGYPSVMLDVPKNTVFSGFVLRGRSISQEDPLDDLFKKYVFFTDAFRNEMIKKSSMTTRALTSGTAIKNMEFIYPTQKEEQYIIGEYLTKLDYLITFHQRKYDKLIIVKKSMLYKMFPIDSSNVPEIRFGGFTDEWKFRKLGDCFSERSESMPNGELISITINDGIKKFSELGRHDNSNEDKSKYKKVCVGDIAYNSMRMWQGASGYSPYEGIVSPAYTVLAPNEGIDSKCISYLFKRPDMIHTFQINSQGITSDNWNLKYPSLSEIEILIPNDIREQNYIAEYFTNLDKLITLQQRKIEKLRNIRSSCMEKMFV